jgi:AcrR family transcriptional regulator
MGTPDTDDPILDAARATVLDFGMRRMTVSEVARRAGVSRMTVYRRYPDGESLLRAVMAREFVATIDLGEAEVDGAANALDAFVTQVTAAVALLLEHPVLLRLLEVDIELLLPYFTTGPGRFQQVAIARMTELIEQGQRAGTIRAGDARTMAESLELWLRGPVLAARTLDDERRRIAVEEARRMLRAYLEPGT